MLHHKQWAKQLELLQLWLSHYRCLHIHIPVHTCTLQTVCPQYAHIPMCISQICCHSRPVVHTWISTLKHSYTSRTRPDCCGWRYMVASLITRASLWSNQVWTSVNRTQCSRAKTGPCWLVDMRGLPGLFMTSGGTSISWQMDGWMMIRMRQWFHKAKWDTVSTGGRFLRSSIHPTAKWEPAAGMENSLFNLHLYNANTTS